MRECEPVVKVIMINDCAFVGDTLLKYLPCDMEKQHIKRGRGLWSKTIGLTYRLLRAGGDVYHVHYLLQDCYIAARLGKRPLIGHVHGSDLRSSLLHPLWGRIVRFNLKTCDRLFVSTPDVLEQAKKYRDDADYLPNPVDTELFYPKPVLDHSGRKRVLIASDANWKVKGTDIAIRALSSIKEDVVVAIISHGVDFDKTIALASSLGLRLNVLPKVCHEKLNEYYWNADVVIDQFNLGSLGLVSLEAIACGRPVVAYVASEYEAYAEFPLKDANTVSQIAEAVTACSREIMEKEYAFLIKYHAPQKVAKKVMDTYAQLLNT